MTTEPELQNILLTPSLHVTDPNMIAFNRQGQLTSEQIVALRYMNTSTSTIVGTLFLLILGGVMVGGSILIRYTVAIAPIADVALVNIAVGLAIFIALAIVSMWVRFIRVKRELANPEIVEAEGVASINWRGQTLATVGNKNLHILSGVEGLQPGRYRFYYLARGRYLVSAELLDDSETAVGNLLKILAKGNRFSLDELEMNRQGYISVRQRFRLLLVSFWGFFMLGTSVLIMYLYVSYNDTSSFISFGIVFLLLGLGTVYALWTAFVPIIDILLGNVKVMTGIGRRSWSSGGGRMPARYYYVIGDQKFRVSYRAVTSLVEGLNYRVYYAPRSKRLLTIEPIDSE